MMTRDPVAAEALRQAGRLESRAAETANEEDMRAATMLRLFYAMIQDDNADGTAGKILH
jgi:hypothetical protein